MKSLLALLLIMLSTVAAASAQTKYKVRSDRTYEPVFDTLENINLRTQNIEVDSVALADTIAKASAYAQNLIQQRILTARRIHIEDSIRARRYNLRQSLLLNSDLSKLNSLLIRGIPFKQKFNIFKISNSSNDREDADTIKLNKPIYLTYTVEDDTLNIEDRIKRRRHVNATLYKFYKNERLIYKKVLVVSSYMISYPDYEDITYTGIVGVLAPQTPLSEVQRRQEAICRANSEAAMKQIIVLIAQFDRLFKQPPMTLEEYRYFEAKKNYHTPRDLYNSRSNFITMLATELKKTK